MEPLFTAPTPRRSFLQRFAAGTAALLAGGAATAHAAPARRPVPSAARSSDDEWLDRLHGDHRQVFDLVEPNSGFGAAFALNYMETYKLAHPDVSDDDISSVLVFRHFAMPLLVNDAIWAKYPLGQFLNVNDPETNAPATRNIFCNNVPLHEGVTYERMINSGSAVMVACNLALTVASQMAGQQIGVPADEAKAEWTANMLPGTFIAPSGVYAVGRAQEAGCTYCYGG